MKLQEKTLEVSYRSVVILRMMLSLIFIVASTSHFFKLEQTVKRIEAANFGFIAHVLGTAEIAVILSVMAMLLAGIALLVGFKTRISAIILMAVIIPITLTIQVGQTATLGPLFKNIAILGGLIFFTLNSNIKLKKQ
ncbi:DoxX family protein [Xanthomarina gelatinilytica]|uniref:DoxX family protein n=1 Tax=Xanthomarina gelatinilytica TaxID=1137281 RepID=UPI003AA9CA90